MDRVTQGVLKIAPLRSRTLVSPLASSPCRDFAAQAAPVRDDVSFSHCPKSPGILMRASSSKRFRRRRRASLVQRISSYTAREVCRWINGVDEAWYGQKKAVPCQPNVQTGLLRAAVAPPFILLSLVSKAAHGNS
jgi:hypothetical protein